MRGSIRFAFTATALLCLAPVLAGCNEPKVANARLRRISQKSAPSPSRPMRARSCVNCRAGSRRCASPTCVRVCPASSPSGRFSRAARSKAGDPLYQVDPRPFEVELKAAEAALAKAHAARDQAELQAKRVAALARDQAASKAQNEVAASNSRQAEAEVAAREADVARAKLNLEYATIRAPIRGRIGAALVSEGALVVQNDQPISRPSSSSTTSMPTSPSRSPRWSGCAAPSNPANSIRSRPDAVRARLVLDDGSVYPICRQAAVLRRQGRCLYGAGDAARRVRQSESRAAARHVCPCPHRAGLRRRCDRGAGAGCSAQCGGGSEVFVVKDDNHVAVQPVRVGSQQDGQWLVLDGLKPGARVVVEGFQKFAAGDAVVPVSVEETKAAAPASCRPPTTQPAGPQKKAQ